MQLVITVQQCDGQTPATKIGAAAVLFLSIDIVWLVVLPRLIEKYHGGVMYLQPLRDNASAKWTNHSRLPSVLGFLAVAAISATVASVVSAPDAPAAAGALAGAVIFSIFDITTWLTTPEWSIQNAVVDTAYGSMAWAAVFAVLHALWPAAECYHRLNEIEP